MLATPLTTANTANPSSIPGLTSNKPTAQTSAEAQQDRFLKLLVAQLNNQDPMNPMDNAQMTTQMAQINTVAGIEKLNTTIQSMADQFAAQQQLQATTMIGRDVLSAGNLMGIANGVGRGAIELSGDADKVEVQLLSAGGQVVDTINLGALKAGRQTFDWNASNYPTLTSLTMKITATRGTQSVGASPLSRDTVTQINKSDSGLTLSLRSGGQVAYSDVQAIL